MITIAKVQKSSVKTEKIYLALAIAIFRLIIASELFCQNAMDLATQKYSWEAITQQLINYYQIIVAKELIVNTT